MNLKTLRQVHAGQENTMSDEAECPAASEPRLPAGIEARQDAMAADYHDLSTRLAATMAEVEDLSERLDAIDERLDAIDERLDESDTSRAARFTEVESQVIDDADMLGKLRKRLHGIAPRLDAVDTKIADLQRAIDGMIAAKSEPVVEDKPEPAELVLLAPVKPVCPKCGSPDGWPLDGFMAGKWYCKRCGLPESQQFSKVKGDK